MRLMTLAEWNNLLLTQQAEILSDAHRAIGFLRWTQRPQNQKRQSPKKAEAQS